MSSVVQWGIVAAVAIAAVLWHRGAFSNRPDAAAVKAHYEQGAVFVDVRTLPEWSAGHLRGALHLPLADLEARAASALPDRNRPIVIYCQSGGRAVTAERQLRQLGYTQVTAMRGGIGSLAQAGYPLVR